MTAAPLPEGYTRFYLQLRPLGSPPAVSFAQLIQPVGTTYTFTPTDDERGSNLITHDLQAAKPPLQPGLRPQLGDVVVTTRFLVPTLRYDTLDITGAVAMGGSYAFLVTAGDPASAIDNFGYSFPAAAELRIHPTDASGKSRATFYDTVQVGDTFDYWTNNPYCGFRFRVTSAVTAATGGTAYGTFGLESVASALDWCEEGVDDPGAARDVEFSWGPHPGWPGVDGVRVMIPGEPVDAGTYRVNPSFPYVIDVPAGIEISAMGFVILTLAPDTSARGVSTHILPLRDMDTGAVLSIDAETGLEAERFDTTPAVDAMFDQIIASIRTVD